MVTYGELYSNIFEYKLYIGLCLLLMLIYSFIYFFLAIYVERINPGQFGVPQPLNYIFKKSHWKSSAVSPAEFDNNFKKISNGIADGNDPTMKINRLNKVTRNDVLISNH